MQNRQSRDAVLAAAELWLGRNKSNARVFQALSEVVSMLRRLNGRDDVLSKRNLLILAAVALYTIFPVDAISDTFPVVGWLDDLALIGLALRAIDGKLQKDDSLAEAA